MLAAAATDFSTSYAELIGMARKRYSDEGCLRLLREIALQLSSGSDVPSACRAAGIRDATYYTWRKKFGGMGPVAIGRVEGAGEGEQPAKEDRGGP